MERRYDELERRYEELNRLIADPEVMADAARYRELLKEHASLEDVVDLIRRRRQAVADLEEARALEEEGADAETLRWIQEERRRLQDLISGLDARLKEALEPRDPNDEKNVIMEIRAGAGGDEAALFAADLFRMYQRYADRRGWKTEVLSLQESDLGGIREVIFSVSGRGAYSRLKWESGVHRVQRVPVTESAGRIHTSTATVAVLPEAEEVDVTIDPDDLQIDTFRASGPGGQHVNKTESAIRITHLPTGIVVTCQDEKSQHKNRERAMKILRARLYDRLESERRQKEAEARRKQVGTGDRSERIRTYNFPQSRVTDHRGGITLHRLDEVLAGDLDLLLDQLVAAGDGA
ncbi:MAG: peptide chain release factor 1 [Bacillota bacterium]|nr:peptide chain release factor 1 [Bacillota bacterium]REJ37935.1 MAG: peptide chain release factor 1 [Bacillota bacterium]